MESPEPRLRIVAGLLGSPTTLRHGSARESVKGGLELWTRRGIEQ